MNLLKLQIRNKAVFPCKNFYLIIIIIIIIIIIVIFVYFHHSQISLNYR